MLKVCGIYKITSLTNSIYIGQSVDVYSRWYFYKKYCAEGQFRLDNSLKKHGIENHKFEIIEECPREKLNEREIYWIQFYNSFNTPHGMNLHSGGKNYKKSEETKERSKRALFGKKRRPYTEDEKKRASEIAKGRKFTEDHKQNISKASLGKEKSPEQIKKRLDTLFKNNTNVPTEKTREKLSLAGIGRIVSKESVNKSIETKRINGTLTRTIEQKQKMSKSQQGKSVSKETIEKVKETKIKNGTNKCTEEARKKHSENMKRRHEEKKLKSQQ